MRSLAEAASVPRIALVGPTAADVRDIMVEGESGLLAICPNSNCPVHKPSKRRLTWNNGVQAAMFSSEEEAEQALIVGVVAGYRTCTGQ